jgi:hypothetical protein
VVRWSVFKGNRDDIERSRRSSGGGWRACLRSIRTGAISLRPDLRELKPTGKYASTAPVFICLLGPFIYCDPPFVRAMKKSSHIHGGCTYSRLTYVHDIAAGAGSPRPARQWGKKGGGRIQTRRARLPPNPSMSPSNTSKHARR